MWKGYVWGIRVANSGHESCAGRSDWEVGDGVGSRSVLKI